MTVVPLFTIADLEFDAGFAKLCEAAHRSPAGDGCLGCDECTALIRQTVRAHERLEAARSQLPERHIPADGAQARRKLRDQESMA